MHKQFVAQKKIDQFSSTPYFQHYGFDGLGLNYNEDQVFSSVALFCDG